MREYLTIRKETTYGTRPTPGSGLAKNTDYIVVRLDQSNAYTARPAPKTIPVKSFDVFNRKVIKPTYQTALAGKLRTMLYPEQAQFLFDMGCKLTGSTNPNSQSYTIDHAIAMDDSGSTIVYQGHVGIKVETFHLSATREAPILIVELDLVGQKPVTITGTDYPEPALSEFPAGVPYALTHMSTPGNLVMNTDRGSEFGSFDWTVKNALDPTFMASQYITRLKWAGRDSDLTSLLIYQTAADRADYEAQTSRTLSARIDNGTNHVVLAFNGNNKIEPVQDDLGLDKVFLQTLTWQNMVDTAVGGLTGDFSYTIG